MSLLKGYNRGIKVSTFAPSIKKFWFPLSFKLAFMAAGPLRRDARSSSRSSTAYLIPSMYTFYQLGPVGRVDSWSGYHANEPRFKSLFLHILNELHTVLELPRSRNSNKISPKRVKAQKYCVCQKLTRDEKGG